MASAPRRAQPLEYNILLTAVLCLLAAGAVMVYSASSSRILLEGQGNGSTFLIKYVAYGGAGLVVMHVLARHGIGLVLRWTNALLAGAFLLLVLVKTPLGVEINGAQRWLGFGPLQFQPSELMKLAIVLYAVKLLATKPTIVMAPRLLVPLGVVAGGACLLIASQPDLGTALVIAFTLIALLVAAGIPIRYLLIGTAVLALLVALFVLVEPYRRARLTSFVNPWADAGGGGFQSVQGQIALGSGGLFGRGLGGSVQKAFFLPEAHTDFILAIIGEEIGVLGITVLRQALGRRADGDGALPGLPERLHRPRSRAADGGAAPVHLLRVDESRRAARCDGPAAERRDRGWRPSEARCDTIPPACFAW